MSERKIRILPNQSDNLTSQNNLLDIHIPAGMRIDGPKSYISLIGKLATSTTGGVEGVHNLDVCINNGQADNANDLDGGVGTSRVLPTVALVKNAQLISNKKGNLESLRDVNKLRVSQASMMTTFNEKLMNAHTQLGGFSDRPWGYISGFINSGIASYGISAEYIEKEIRIPLDSIYEVFKANNVDTNYLGSLHLHLEMDMDRLRVHTAYKNETGPEGNKAFTTGGSADKQGFGVIKNDVTQQVYTAVTLARDYVHGEHGDCPFYLGQMVELQVGKGTVAGAPVGAGAGRSKVTQISTVAGEVLLGLTPGIDASGGAGGLVDVALIPTVPTAKSFTVTKVECVLQENDGAPAMNGLDYTTFTTEKDNGNNVQILNRQYETEPEAINLLVHMSAEANGLLSTRRPVRVRVNINNENTTNRDITRHSPIYNDRLSRYVLNQGKKVHSLAQGQRIRTGDDNLETPAELNTEAWIYEPLPSTGKMNLVELDVNAGANIGDIVLFKEVVRSV